MSVAIYTRFLGPTNHRGARVAAYTIHPKRRVVVSWDYNVNDGANHDAAAVALARKLEVYGDLVRGFDAPDRAGNVYVFAERVAPEADGGNTWRCERITVAP